MTASRPKNEFLYEEGFASRPEEDNPNQHYQDPHEVSLRVFDKLEESSAPRRAKIPWRQAVPRLAAQQHTGTKVLTDPEQRAPLGTEPLGRSTADVQLTNAGAKNPLCATCAFYTQRCTSCCNCAQTTTNRMEMNFVVDAWPVTKKKAKPISTGDANQVTKNKLNASAQANRATEDLNELLQKDTEKSATVFDSASSTRGFATPPATMLRLKK